MVTSCTHVSVPDTKACAVAGVLTAGANCAHTLTDETNELTFEEFVKFLEPDPIEARGAAICQSADDWNKQKTALETACQKLGAGCSFELKQAIQSISSRIDSLIEKSKHQKERPKIKSKV